MCKEFYQQIGSVHVEFAPSILLKLDQQKIKQKIKKIARLCSLIASGSVKFEETPYDLDKQKITVFHQDQPVYRLICRFDRQNSFYIFHSKSILTPPLK